MRAQPLRMLFLILLLIESIGRAHTGTSGVSQDVSRETVAGSPAVQQNSAPRAMNTPSQASTSVKLGQSASRKMYGEAIASYQQQILDAHNKGDHEGEAIVALKAARVADALSAMDSSQLPVAESAYRRAIAAAKESSQTGERSLAANNLAVLLMKSGKNQAALEAISDIDISAADSSQEQAVFSYNAGRAYELNGEGTQAFEKYLAAYTLNPDFTQAAVNGFRLLQTEKKPQIANAVKLSDLAAASGHAQIAHEPLLTLIRNSELAADAQRLLAALVRCYVSENLSPLDFRGKELKPLTEAAHLSLALPSSCFSNQKCKGVTSRMNPTANHASSEPPDLRLALEQIVDAYDGNLPPFPLESVARFSMWQQQQWQYNTLAPLLSSAARWFAEREQPEQALGRYMVAWNTTRDPKYALEFASLLRLNSDLDENGRLLNSLLDSMFMAKGISYAKLDWNSIFQMHVAIGSIFEEKGTWGTEGQVRGATFQWQHAIAAYQQLHTNEVSPAPAPGLHAHLALCYSRTGQPQRAAQEFLLAAEGFVSTGDLDQAQHNLDLAKQCACALLPGDEIRLQKIEDAISARKL